MSCCASAPKRARQDSAAAAAAAAAPPTGAQGRAADAATSLGIAEPRAGSPLSKTDEPGRPPSAAQVALLAEADIAALTAAGAGRLTADVQSHFYQKFENEQEGRQKALEDLTKRQQMLTLIRGGKWVLEVSLKHSGSLGHYDGEVMWSKNSVDNAYTAAFENLLFDCFRRAFPDTPEGTAAAVAKFQRFSQVRRVATFSLG